MKTLLKRSIPLVVVLLCCIQPLHAQTDPVVAFESSSSAHYETYSPTVPIKVILSQPSSSAVYVEYAVTGGTATGGGVDYYLYDSELTFAPGETEKNIIIYMVHDLYGETNETIIISLRNPTNATLGSPDTHTYTIGNDDWNLFGFMQSSASGLESQSTVNVAVGYFRGWFGGADVSVDYVVTGGTATAGADYILSSGTLTIPFGQDTNDIKITIIDNSSSEDDETIKIRLTGDPNTIGLNSTFIYTIIDDDDETPPTISEYYPEPNAIQVPRDTYIKLGITDNLIGVDANTVRILVEGNLVYNGSMADVNGTYTSSFGTCRRSGTEAKYAFVFQPLTRFDYEQEVNVVVYATDKYNNTMPKQSYKFYILMRAFGKNLKVNNGLDIANQDHPSTAADSLGNIWVVWDQSMSIYDSGIYIGKLKEGKNAFETSSVACDDPGIQNNPVIAIDSKDNLYVAWQDQSALGNKWNIYVSKSEDGTTWSVPVVVKFDESSNIYNQTLPAIAIDEAATDVIYIACEDDRDGNKDIWISSSTDCNSWTPRRITTNTMDQSDPTIAVNNHIVYLGWTDSRNASTDFYGTNSGISWANIVVVGTGSNQSSISYAADPIDNVVHEFWADNVSGNYDILYRKTGTTSNGVSVTDEPGVGKNNPASGFAVIDGAGVPFAAWRDWRNVLSNNDTDIYYAEKTSTGFSTNILINDDIGTSLQKNPAVGVNSNGDPYIVWTDQRNGNDDIYYSGVTSYGDPLTMEYILHIDYTLIQTSNLVEIKIPTGAMPDGFTYKDVSVLKVINPPALPDGCFGICYDISPNGITFNTPITITIPHSSDDCPNLSSYQVYWYNNQTGTWSQEGISEVQHYEISDTLHAVIFKSTHFTSFIVGAGGTPNPGNIDVGDNSSGGGGCAMSPYAQSSDGALGYFLEYIVYLVILVAISRKYKSKRISE